MNRNMWFVFFGLFLIVIPMIAIQFVYSPDPDIVGYAGIPPTETEMLARRITQNAIYFQIAGALLIAFGYRKRITKVARKIS